LCRDLAASTIKVPRPEGLLISSPFGIFAGVWAASIKDIYIIAFCPAGANNSFSTFSDVERFVELAALYDVAEA